MCWCNVIFLSQGWIVRLVMWFHEVWPVSQNWAAHKKRGEKPKWRTFTTLHRFRADDEYSPKGREHTTIACSVHVSRFRADSYSPMGREHTTIQYREAYTFCADSYSPKGREHTTIACKVVTTIFNCGCCRSIEVNSPLGLKFVVVPR